MPTFAPRGSVGSRSSATRRCAACFGQESEWLTGRPCNAPATNPYPPQCPGRASPCPGPLFAYWALAPLRRERAVCRKLVKCDVPAKRDGEEVDDLYVVSPVNL